MSSVHQLITVQRPSRASGEDGVRMDMKPGYKQTEVGVIPVEWQSEVLAKVLAVVGGGTPSTSIHEFWDGMIPWVSAGDVSQAKGRYVLDTMDHISELGLSSCPARILPKGTVVIIARGATTGRMAQLGSDMAFNQTCYGLRAAHGLDQDYLYYAMQYSIGSTDALTYGTIFRTITTQSFQQWRIPVPTLAEQQAIAEALSDVDALIGALDRLIAKKRAIKQGAMQELLTGRRRLPGFDGVWEMRRLGELGATYGGLTGKTKSDFGNGSARYIPFLNIITNVVIDPYDLELVCVAPSERQNQAQVGDLFFNGSSETPEEVGMCSVLLDDLGSVYLNSFCFGFRLEDHVEAHGLYLAYFFRSGEGRALLYSLAQGATRYNLSKTNFLRLEIPFPAFQEQTAIAAILSDMDAEIAALERRRDKTKLLKQGMMQELLTGRIRLV